MSPRGSDRPWTNSSDTYIDVVRTPGTALPVRQRCPTTCRFSSSTTEARTEPQRSSGPVQKRNPPAVGRNPNSPYWSSLTEERELQSEQECSQQLAIT